MAKDLNINLRMKLQGQQQLQAQLKAMAEAETRAFRSGEPATVSAQDPKTGRFMRGIKAAKATPGEVSLEIEANIRRTEKERARLKKEQLNTEKAQAKESQVETEANIKELEKQRRESSRNKDKIRKQEERDQRVENEANIREGEQIRKKRAAVEKTRQSQADKDERTEREANIKLNERLRKDKEAQDQKVSDALKRASTRPLNTDRLKGKFRRSRRKFTRRIDKVVQSQQRTADQLANADKQNRVAALNDYKRERQSRLALSQDRIRADKKAKSIISRQEAADQRAAKLQEQMGSRTMMGVAGVVTAATMPVSGFSPLTIGFASMSGVGYGVAAGVAVLGRAAFDTGAALVRWREGLIQAAEAAEAVSKAYKRQKKNMEVLNLALGASMADRTIKPLNTRQLDRLSKLSDIEMAGRGAQIVKEFFQSFGDTILASLGQTLPIGERKGRKELLIDLRNNLLANRRFSASFEAPEQMWKRIQSAAASRGEDEMQQQLEAIDRNIKALEKNSTAIDTLSQIQSSLGPYSLFAINPAVAAAASAMRGGPRIFGG